MKTLKNPIGERIRIERERQNIGQAELADTVGLSQKSLSQIESGKVSPRKGTIVAIEIALNLKVGSLYGKDQSHRPTHRQLLQLIELDAGQLPYLPLALVLERFSKENPQVRAAVLAVLYGDPAIARLGASRDKANSQ